MASNSREKVLPWKRICACVALVRSTADGGGLVAREVPMTLRKWEPGRFSLPGVRPGSVFGPDGGT